MYRNEISKLWATAVPPAKSFVASDERRSLAWRFVTNEVTSELTSEWRTM